jgi:hypothetical protein
MERRTSLAAAALALVFLVGGTTGEAHKPVTSAYTFNEHVFPIVRERCGACHVSGGVAPMSLMTHAEAVPWAESIRSELIAGHMPPWPVDMPRERFRRADALTARELNVILTWATGGTPIGDGASPPAVALPDGWPLGPPDLELPLDEVVIPAATQDRVASFVVATGTTERRWVRAVDLRPGTPAVVRNASILVQPADDSASPAGPVVEPSLAVWVPGEPPVPVDGGAGFELPAGASLAVRVHYRKTWEYERKEMRDRSRVGLYFAPAAAAPVEAVMLTTSFPATGAGAATTGTSYVLTRDVRAVAVYPDASLTHAYVRLDAVRPDGSQEELLAIRAQPDWARRYWFRDPVALPRGTRIDMHATFDDESTVLPPGAPPPAPLPSDPPPIRMTIDVIKSAP